MLSRSSLPQPQYHQAPYTRVVLSKYNDQPVSGWYIKLLLASLRLLSSPDSRLSQAPFFLACVSTFSSFEPRLNVEQVTWSLFYRGHEEARRFWTSRQAMPCRLWRHCGPVTPLSPPRLPPSPFLGTSIKLDGNKLFIYFEYILGGLQSRCARSDDI